SALPSTASTCCGSTTVLVSRPVYAGGWTATLTRMRAGDEVELSSAWDRVSATEPTRESAPRHTSTLCTSNHATQARNATGTGRAIGKTVRRSRRRAVAAASAKTRWRITGFTIKRSSLSSSTVTKRFRASGWARSSARRTAARLATARQRHTATAPAISAPAAVVIAAATAPHASASATTGRRDLRTALAITSVTIRSSGDTGRRLAVHAVGESRRRGCAPHPHLDRQQEQRRQPEPLPIVIESLLCGFETRRGRHVRRPRPLAQQAIRDGHDFGAPKIRNDGDRVRDRAQQQRRH